MKIPITLFWQDRKTIQINTGQVTLQEEGWLLNMELKYGGAASFLFLSNGELFDQSRDRRWWKMIAEKLEVPINEP